MSVTDNSTTIILIYIYRQTIEKACFVLSVEHMKHVDMKKVHDSEQRTDYALVLFIGYRPKIFIIGSVLSN